MQLISYIVQRVELDHLSGYAPIILLHHMSQFVSQQPLTSRVMWVISARSKVNIVAIGKGLGVQLPIHLDGFAVCMNPHWAEVSIEAGFHKRAHLIRQRTPSSLPASKAHLQAVTGLEAVISLPLQQRFHHKRGSSFSSA